MPRVNNEQADALLRGPREGPYLFIGGPRDGQRVDVFPGALSYRIPIMPPVNVAAYTDLNPQNFPAISVGEYLRRTVTGLVPRRTAFFWQGER